MSNRTFIKLIRSEKIDWLQEFHPNAYLLLSLIARRARRTPNAPDGKRIGEAHIGDFQKAGIDSESKYRTAKKILIQIGAINICETCRNRKNMTTGMTTKGTLVKLLNSEYWDINPQVDDDLIDDRMTTGSRPDDDEQEVKEVKKEKFTFLLKKESEKEKEISLTSQSLSFKDIKKNEDFLGIRIYCESKGFPIKEEDVYQWLNKYSAERITSNISLIIEKYADFNIKQVVAAIKADYAGEPERILQNRNFAIDFKNQNAWESLIINLQYCRCEIAKESINFKLPPKTFEEVLFKIHQTQRENFA